MIPLVPAFATMRSVLSAWARCHQFDRRQAIRLRGKNNVFDHDCELGEGIHKLDTLVFRGNLEREQLIKQHTHVPLCSAFLSVAQELQWDDYLLRAPQRRDVMAAALRKNNVFEASTLRRCPSCMDEDVTRYGCAHWRLFHQWPLARHCAVHGDVLESRCADCRTPFVRRREPQLADDPCPTCGSEHGEGDGRDPSPGYRATLALMHRGLCGLALELRPMARAATLGGMATDGLRRNRLDDHHAQLLRLVMAAWQITSGAELAAALGIRQPCIDDSICPLTGSRLSLVVHAAAVAGALAEPDGLGVSSVSNAGLDDDSVPRGAIPLHAWPRNNRGKLVMTGTAPGWLAPSLGSVAPS